MTQPTTIRFAWSGKNFKGQHVSGESEAIDTASLKRLLYSQGVLVSVVRKVRPVAKNPRHKKIPPAERAIFLRQCASLLQAGLPLVQALDICLDSTSQPAFKLQLQLIREQLAGGANFSDALSMSTLGDDRLLINLIRAAEQSGTLDSMMEKLASDSEKSQRLRAKVHKALIYPVTVLVVAVIVTVLLLVKVVPRFAQTFSDLGAELPALTRSVLALSELAARYSLIVSLLAAALMLICAVCLKRYKRLRIWKDRMMCGLPVTGSIVKHACLARFCQILGSSIKAGVPMVQALQSSASATGNLVFEQASLALAEWVNQGQTLSYGVRKTQCFPVMIGQLIYAGEQSGTLDQMLENCATRYEQSVDNAVDKLGSLIEPVIMTVLGVIIATLLLAMYLPVFRLGAVL